MREVYLVVPVSGDDEVLPSRIYLADNMGQVHEALKADKWVDRVLNLENLGGVKADLTVLSCSFIRDDQKAIAAAFARGLTGAESKAVWRFARSCGLTRKAWWETEPAGRGSRQEAEAVDQRGESNAT